ncbi:hypothetical protein [Prevotella falsenii]|nr:hypothetical protein [Prevotella falsenii]
MFLLHKTLLLCPLHSLQKCYSLPYDYPEMQEENCKKQRAAA